MFHKSEFRFHSKIANLFFQLNSKNCVNWNPESQFQSYALNRCPFIIQMHLTLLYNWHSFYANFIYINVHLFYSKMTNLCISNICDNSKTCTKVALTLWHIKQAKDFDFGYYWLVFFLYRKYLSFESLRFEKFWIHFVCPAFFRLKIHFRKVCMLIMMLFK